MRRPGDMLEGTKAGSVSTCRHTGKVQQEVREGDRGQKAKGRVGSDKRDPLQDSKQRSGVGLFLWL